jgi:hypothetical protein
MPDGRANPLVDATQEDSTTPADINITARGDRRTLEVLYLELRELAKANGLTVEYKLTMTKPADQPDG